MEKSSPSRTAVCPFTVTVTGLSSWTLPLTWIELSLKKEPSAGWSSERTGGVVSVSTVKVLVADAVFPTWSAMEASSVFVPWERGDASGTVQVA